MKHLDDHSLKLLKEWMFFCCKILVMTAIFTIAWILLLHEQPLREQTSDREYHDDTIPDLEELYEVQPSTIKEQQQADTLLESLMQQVDTMESIQQHNSAPLSVSQARKNLQIMCSVYADICNKMVWDKELSDIEKLFYQAVIIAQIREIDKDLEQ